MMEIRESAHRHGIADPDIHHAIDNAVTAGSVETNIDRIDGVLYIGPDRTGRIHAMSLRKAYERYLPKEDRP